MRIALNAKRQRVLVLALCLVCFVQNREFIAYNA